MGAHLRCQVIWGSTLLFGVYCIVCLIPASSVAQITFERTYGGSEGEFGHSVQQTQDGGYVIAGGTDSFGAGNCDVYLIKTDSVGDTIWTRTYGGVADDYGLSVQRTQDGGYIVAGDTRSFGAGYCDVYLIKTDSVGDTIWTRTYGGVADDNGYSVQQTQDGGYIIAGVTSAGGYDVYLIKTDSVGDSVWSRSYGGPETEKGHSVRQTQDGGYIIGGETNSFGAGVSDVYLIKTDSAGDSMWTRTYGGTLYDFGWSVQQTQDGGYIVAGGATSFGAGADDVYLVKADSVGDSMWTRTYGGIGGDRAYSVQQTQDGGYIVAGGIGHFGTGEDTVYLIKTDSEGDSVWSRTYGGTGEDRAYCVQQTQDGGYVIVARTYSFGAGGWDVYLIKTDENGLTGVGEEKSESGNGVSGIRIFQNHPNPFKRSTLIFYSLPAPAEVTLSIYDVTGRMVETLVNETQEPGIHQVRWDRKSNPSGVYFCSLRAGEFVETRKMVVVE